jgi:2-dehydropantoate 2-reductase
MLFDAMQEIYTLAQARDIELPENSVQKTIDTLESFPANSTTSMQRDLVDGLPSELDAQNGAVVRLAEEVEVDTPVNRFILGSLRSLELRACGALKF